MRAFYKQAFRRTVEVMRDMRSVRQWGANESTAGIASCSVQVGVSGVSEVLYLRGSNSTPSTARSLAVCRSSRMAQGGVKYPPVW